VADKKISELTAKTTPVDNDAFPIYDSVASATKKVLLSALKAVLKTYFDTIYGTAVSGEALGGSGVNRTLAHSPLSGSLLIYDDGIVLTGGGEDYTQSGTTVTFVEEPTAPRAYYRY